MSFRSSGESLVPARSVWRGAALVRGIETAIFLTARLPPKQVLNGRLPRITQRMVLPSASLLRSLIFACGRYLPSTRWVVSGSRLFNIF
jgi:hypothetical protein